MKRAPPLERMTFADRCCESCGKTADHPTPRRDGFILTHGTLRVCLLALPLGPAPHVKCTSVVEVRRAQAKTAFMATARFG